MTGLRSLEVLELDNNLITQVTHEFDNLTNLEVLGLDSNQITTINPNAFIHNTNLVTLNLINNPIVDLTHNHFSHLTNLQDLGISRHSMEQREEWLLDEMPLLNMFVDEQ